LPTLTPLPLSSHAKPVDSFAHARELEAELQKTMRGEVRFDPGSRALYATDGSNYRQIPIGLVIPRDSDDVIAAVAACRHFGAPVLARGAGTSLAGQGCNVAVILDFTHEFSRAWFWTRCEIERNRTISLLRRIPRRTIAAPLVG
jgi:hypothetical protein